MHPAVRSDGVLNLCSLCRVSGGDVWLRLPAAVWVYEQRHLRLRDGNLLLQHRLQRHPLRPGWEMMALHGGRRTCLWLSDECLKLLLPVGLHESWYIKDGGGTCACKDSHGLTPLQGLFMLQFTGTACLIISFISYSVYNLQKQFTLLSTLYTFHEQNRSRKKKDVYNLTFSW